MGHPGWRATRWARRRSLRLAAGLIAALASGCSQEGPAPLWIELARGYRPEALLPLVQTWQREAGHAADTCSTTPVGVEVRHRLGREAWTPGDVAGVWRAADPGGALTRGPRGFARLEADGGTLGEALPDTLPESTFRYQDGRIEANFGAAGPPAETLLFQRLDNGRAASDGTWQVRLGDTCGTGIPLWSGRTVDVRCALPAHGRLSFELQFHSRSAAPGAALRILLDGQPVGDAIRVEAVEHGAAASFHSIVLPPALRPDAQLAFELEGTPGRALILHPVIGPAEIGVPDARPWSAARPDVVLFLADTFRADGLASNGGDPDLAPGLNRFAAQALAFTRARSNAAWTLPSISTLLSGLSPGQHNVNQVERALPGEIETVVEALARSGYRTGAVTDAGFFTPAHGLEQGFERFVLNPPQRWSLEWTVRRALEFLEHDDGRPLFLLVHTYRTHNPYRTGAAEDLEPWRALQDAGCRPLKDKERLPRDEYLAEVRACAPRFRALYREGVRALDEGFVRVHDAMAQGGYLRSGFLVFTSDHGEALGENDELFHGEDLFESKLRIPLLIGGRGLAPRAIDAAVSLLDLAPTLAELGGLPRHPAWLGESVLAARPGRPVLAFRLQSTAQLVLVEGDRKLTTRHPATLAEGRPESAFDLSTDPGEEHEVQDAPWPAELARRHAELVRAMLTPVHAPVAAQVSAEERRTLDALGYGGDDDG